MSTYSWGQTGRTADAVRIRVQPEGRSFIGLRASTPEGEDTWLAPVILELLARHDRVLLLLESELMTYERCADLRNAVPLLQPAAESDLVTEETMSRWRDVDRVRRALPSEMVARVQIASWSHFIDPTFASLWRHLLTAFAVGTVFRKDVLELGDASMRRWRGQGAAAQAARAACLSHVESLAMRLRVGEVAGYHHEYGRGHEELLVERLYAGAYVVDGLTVESLVGHQPRRSYRRA
jgi:hypothetical protein